MKPKHKAFLLIDGIVNLILGLLLLLFPFGVAETWEFRSRNQIFIQ